MAIWPALKAASDSIAPHCSMPGGMVVLSFTMPASALTQPGPLTVAFMDSESKNLQPSFRARS